MQENSFVEIFSSSIPWEEKRPTDLVVCCSDGRYHSHIENFVDRVLALPQSDLLMIPGGPHAFQLVSIYPKARWASKFFLEFLTKHHPISRIVLVGHENCFWYESILLGNIELNMLKKRQQQDLRNVSEIVRGICPGSKVELYFARPENKTVLFSKLD